MSDYPNFTEAEMVCTHCGAYFMDEDFMWKLVALRKRVGVPFKISSACRCEVHNKAVKSTSTNHVQGKAVDIVISGPAAWRIIELAAGYGFTGLGIKQNGDHSGRYIHLDTAHDTFTVWTY